MEGIKKSSHYAGSFYVCSSINLRRDQMDLGPKTGSFSCKFTSILFWFFNSFSKLFHSSPNFEMLTFFFNNC